MYVCMYVCIYACMNQGKINFNGSFIQEVVFRQEWSYIEDINLLPSYMHACLYECMRAYIYNLVTKFFFIRLVQ